MPFRFLRRRRNAKLKAKAIELGNQMMEEVNRKIELWRMERMEPRREMWAASFDERIVALEPQEALSFDEIAEIEALALLKQWHLGKVKCVAEVMEYLSDDDIEFLDMIEAGDRFTEVIYEKFDEVGLALANQVTQTIEEARERRSQRGDNG